MNKKQILILLIILFPGLNTYSQATLRKAIIKADTILTGNFIAVDPKLKNDYECRYDAVAVKNTGDTVKVVQGVLFLYEEEEDIDYLFFLKKVDYGYYMINYCYTSLENSIKEMKYIEKIKNEREKFNKTIEWFIRILETKRTDLFIELEYNELYKNSMFHRYYKEKGFISSIDSILNSKQKKRVLKGLLKLDKWDNSELEFVKLIYKDFPGEINKHIAFLIEKILKRKESHVWDMMKLIRIMNFDNQSIELSKLLDELDSVKKCDSAVIRKAYKKLSTIIKNSDNSQK